MGAGPAVIARFTASSARLIDLELRSQLAGRWRMATLSVIFAAIPAVIYLSAGLPLTAGSLTIGTLIAFTTLQAGLFRPMTGPAQRRGVAGQLAGPVRADLRVPGPAGRGRRAGAPGRRSTRPRVAGHVRFEDVTFAYPGSDTAAVAGVTLDVPAGSTLALVGETGSGKSTLAALVARLYDPAAGRITIDGVDLRDLRLADLAAVVGVVSQETYLLHTTVRENLRYAKPDATDAEIEAAARAAQIHDLIAALPDGYDTVVGSRGHRFSGGEKQRMAIARTLLRDPRVLVLDEATSALDNETERAVQRAFDEVARGRTTITIAHRLSTVRDADQIAVLDHGRIVESGTPRRPGRRRRPLRRPGRLTAPSRSEASGVRLGGEGALEHPGQRLGEHVDAGAQVLVAGELGLGVRDAVHAGDEQHHRGHEVLHVRRVVAGPGLHPHRGDAEVGGHRRGQRPPRRAGTPARARCARTDARSARRP